ncbi:MAG TPA: hypothetical protein VMW16_10135 [Sedimentisphaerales bacterium]|nr:hypothetical protein [Sedimentisphaerales bacterium]
MAKGSENEDAKRLRMEKKGYQPLGEGYEGDDRTEAGYQPDDTGTPEGGNPPTVEDTIDPGGKK